MGKSADVDTTEVAVYKLLICVTCSKLVLNNNNKVIINKSKYTKPQIVYNKHKHNIYNYIYVIYINGRFL